MKNKEEMNVLQLMRFLFITAFLTPIIRYIYLFFIDSILFEWILNSIRNMGTKKNLESNYTKKDRRGEQNGLHEEE